MYYLYILFCDDNTMYTGITTDVKRRFKEHCEGRAKGSKYTKVHKPQGVAYSVLIGSRAEASSFEYKVKHLKKDDKIKLINAKPNSVEKLQNFFSEI